ncbi:MAG: hypothetical protein SGI86_10760, partial [Deltaproteobacteria bacterium]|nr:hypothetical protein [Deltaproteobacteria bacterium]
PTQIVQPKPTDVVQPREEPPPDEEEEEDDGGEDEGEEGGVEGGVVGGVIGGVVGGVVGATGPASSAPTTLPPSVAQGKIIPGSCPKPAVPVAIAAAKMTVFTMTKICVNADGTTKEVKIIKGGDPTWDKNVVDAFGRCKYEPTMVGGNKVPFCYLARITAKIE